MTAALVSPLLGAFVVPRLLPASDPTGRPYTRSSIQGLILGLVLGYFVPTYFLLFSTGEYRQEWNVVWQFLPVTIWAIQEGWVWVRRRAILGGPGEAKVGGWEWKVLGGMLGGASLAGHVVLMVSSPFLTSIKRCRREEKLTTD